MRQHKPANNHVFLISKMYQKNRIDIFYNLKILSKSVFSNFRTYLYIIIFPILLSTLFMFYRTIGDSTRMTPVGVTLILLIPPFMIIFLVNITISEWKNSVFLKRIHSAGVSKHNFIFSVFIFNLFLGYLSFFVCTLYIFLASKWYFKAASGSFWYILYQTMSASTVWGILLGASMVIISSILLGTLISGIFKSVALSQSIAAVILILGIIFSDMIITPERTGVRAWFIYVSYLFPYKHDVWISLLMVSEGSPKLIYDAAPMERITTSFDLKLWIPILTSLTYNGILALLSTYAFSWGVK